MVNEGLVTDVEEWPRKGRLGASSCIPSLLGLNVIRSYLGFLFSFSFFLGGIMFL